MGRGWEPGLLAGAAAAARGTAALGRVRPALPCCSHCAVSCPFGGPSSRELRYGLPVLDMPCRMGNCDAVPLALSLNIPSSAARCCAGCPLMCCRLAAQQLGLFSLVLEVQEAWAQVEATWLSSASSAVDSNGSGSEPGATEQQRQQPAFRDAALAAWEAACPAGGAGSPGAVQGLLQRAAAQLQAMSPDDFPRMLAWSEGLCGLTLLPLRYAPAAFDGWGLTCVGRLSWEHSLNAVARTLVLPNPWSLPPPIPAACLRACCRWRSGRRWPAAPA